MRDNCVNRISLEREREKTTIINDSSPSMLVKVFPSLTDGDGLTVVAFKEMAVVAPRTLSRSKFEVAAHFKSD